MRASGIKLTISALVVAAAFYVVAGNFVDVSKKNGAVDFFPDFRLPLGADVGGGWCVTLALDADRPETTEKSIKTLRRRIEYLGIPEPNAFRAGDARVMAFVPFSMALERFQNLTTTPAALSFHEARSRKGRSPSPGYERLSYVAQGEKSAIDVKTSPLIGETRLESARSGTDRQGRPVVKIRFDRLGAKRLLKATSDSSGKRFAALLDGVVLAVSETPTPISDGRVEISGAFDKEGADDLALLLRSGTLPTGARVEGATRIDPLVGEQGVRHAAIGFGAAFLATAIWLGWTYRAFGVASALALPVNAVMTTAAMTVLGVALTVPGAVGFVASAIAALSGHILMLEGVRSETLSGKKRASAVRDGFEDATPTVGDAGVALLVVAAALHVFGPECVKSFAAALSLGVLSHLFTSITFMHSLILACGSTVRNKGA